MTSRERVITACECRTPDRIPRFDKFWDFPESLRHLYASPDELSDITILAPDETIRPTKAGFLKSFGDDIVSRDGWGSVTRTRHDACFYETLSVVLPPGADPDKLQSDPPELDERYLLGFAEATAAARHVAARHEASCVFAKTGGPYLRTIRVRGQEQFLIDMVEDPSLARAIADRIAEHIAAVGVESIKRWDLYGTGIWIHDDLAYNAGPMFSPATFERVLLPAFRRLIARYHEAGARYVFLHSDGDVRPILDMLVDAGIDGLHPIERRTGMDPWELRERYPRLIFAGGMDNTDLLVNGPLAHIRDESRRLVELGRDGGFIIGSHSISPEVPLAHLIAYDEVWRREGVFGAE